MTNIYYPNQPSVLNPEQLQLPPVERDEFLPRIGSWAIIGGLFLVGTFGAAISISAVLNYNVAVKVPATIRFAGELRLIQSAIAGTVDSIEVGENQIVEQGEAIARLNDSELQIKKSQLQESIRQMWLQLGRVDAQIGSLDTQLVAQSDFLRRTLASAQADLANSERNFRDLQVTTKADLAEAEVALKVAKEQWRRLYQENELEATLHEAEANLKIAKTQRDRLKQILASGAISQNLFEEKEQAVKAAEAKLSQTKASVKKLFEEKAQAVEIAKARLTKAKTSLNPSNAIVIVAMERIGLEWAKGQATLAALNKERENLIEGRIELQKHLGQIHKELTQIETNLKQTIIRAPIAGTLLQLKLRNPEQVVQPGEAIAYIAPINTPLLIEAQVPAQDIDNVKPGQKVKMQVSACPYTDFGTLQGTVKTVAPDALPSTMTKNDTPATPTAYKVTIQPQTNFVGDAKRQCQLQAGMEGRADIISRQETVLKFILRKTRLMVDL
ncbi:HlyD family secretion protein [Chlorogloeopsis sp. ULAP02]|uniref:HlyD family secretion protein n=1 Tax=Chlorogloeopsis sp. ULAP02 TaxID=3107926 RepID=UPI003136AAD4